MISIILAVASSRHVRQFDRTGVERVTHRRNPIIRPINSTSRLPFFEQAGLNPPIAQPILACRIFDRQPATASWHGRPTLSCRWRSGFPILSNCNPFGWPQPTLLAGNGLRWTQYRRSRSIRRPVTRGSKVPGLPWNYQSSKSPNRGIASTSGSRPGQGGGCPRKWWNAGKCPCPDVWILPDTSL